MLVSGRCSTGGSAAAAWGSTRSPTLSVQLDEFCPGLTRPDRLANIVAVSEEDWNSVYTGRDRGDPMAGTRSLCVTRRKAENKGVGQMQCVYLVVLVEGGAERCRGYYGADDRQRRAVERRTLDSGRPVATCVSSSSSHPSWM